MFDRDGNILPQGEITPTLDDEFMTELLAAEVEKKQSYEFPQKVYDELDRQFGGEAKKYQSRGILPENYTTYGVHWGVEDGIISKIDARIVWEAIANIEKRRYNSYKQTVSGNYIIETDTALMVVDSNYVNPVVKEIYVFKDTENYAKELLINEIAGEDERKIQKTQSIIEMVFGEGFVHRYHFRDSNAYGRQTRQGKRNHSGRYTPRINGQEWGITFDQEQKSKSVPKKKRQTRDNDYLTAVSIGDMATAQRMVDEAAKEAGYTEKVHHGTAQFGFTKIRTTGVEEGVEWSPFFAAGSSDISASYVLNGNTRRISSAIGDGDIDSLIEQRQEKITDLIDDFRRLIDLYFSEWVFGQSDNSHIENLVEGASPIAGHSDGVYDVLGDIVADAFYDYGDNFAEYEDFAEWADNSPEAQEIFDIIVEIEAEKGAIYNIESGNDLGGIYELYANTDNLFVVDANGAAWNNLHPEGLPKIERGVYKDIPYKTRDVALWARDNGYDGVLFKNIMDNGQYGRTPAGDVYAFFKPESQVKSADPVTYDDGGNVIPLSERFKSGNDDIRYQEREIDNRALLANALDSVAQNENETKILADYKSKIAKMNAQEQKLAKLKEDVKAAWADVKTARAEGRSKD